MQSSYSVVKSNYVLDGKEKTITTEYEMPDIMNTDDENLSQLELERKNYIASYENIGRNIIADAKRECEKLKLQTMQKVEIIEKEAYQKGYEQGKSNGYEDGKKEAIDSILPQAQAEAESIRNEALQILSKAKDDYNKYMNDKSIEIIKLSFNIAEKILKREVLKDEGIDSMLEEAFEQSKGEDNFVIRCNSAHVKELKLKTENWKKKYNISGEIFIMEDDEMEPGNAWVEKPSGKIEIGIDIGLEKIEKAIFG